jgi:urea transporter/murein DD-endopeptidase MepM/ murein hydrolase activator NlpD
VVVTLPARPGEREPVVSEVRFWTDTILGSYSQILFTRSRPVGLVLIAATFVQPAVGCFGLSAVVLAAVFARLFQFSPDSIRAGLFGYNAMLLGLGLGALYQTTPTLAAVAVAATLVTVLATATLNAALGATFNLPSLTLPFLAVFYLILAGIGELSGIELRPLTYDAWLAGEWLPHPVASYLKSLGAIFFLPRVDAGAMVLVALLFFSRIGFTLSLVGFAVAWPLSLGLIAVPDAQLHLMMGYNLILVAVALGGVWFVARPASFVFALTGVLVAAVWTIGGRALLGHLSLPLLILPFNLTVIPLLYAMRSRIRDSAPKAVDFWMGTPEQNLNYFQTRMARFGYLYYVRFGLPVLGKWVCTQGNDGEHTHQGHWRHGFDFEVTGPDGKTHGGTGQQHKDYFCYRLPVLACADGTVVKVVDTVEDNRIGQVNTRENWGNLVLIYHGPGLYSLVAHLAIGSVKVKEGEIVRRGTQIGLCGNSGRSPTPHIHFQLQGSDRIGAPTIEAAFHEIVTVEDRRETLQANHIPKLDEEVRNPVRDEDLARLFLFPIGQKFDLVERGNRGDRKTEQIESTIDLYGNLSLLSQAAGGILYFENKNVTFTIYDYSGPASSQLSVINAALPRVPFDSAPGLTWTDHLVSRYFFPVGIRLLRDFISPFLGLGGLRMKYSSKRDGPVVTIEGRSAATNGRNEPVMRTRAVARDGFGLVEAEMTLHNRRRIVQRIDPGRTT